MLRSPMKTGVKRIVLAMTGASGAPYAVRLLQALARDEVELHLTVSPSGAAVIKQELGLGLDLRCPDLEALLSYRPHWASSDVASDARSSVSGGDRRGGAEMDQHAAAMAQMHYHQYDDYMTPIASGSFQTDAMVICPCSGSTLSGVARAAASNLIQRAAEVHLKEHRKLVVVPRETPMSVLQLENMLRLAQAGAVILPAMPGWYHGVTSLDSIIDFVVSRILDQIGVENDMVSRWGDPE